MDDFFESQCRIGKMAGRIMTIHVLGTVTLQVGASSSMNLRPWHGGIISSVAQTLLTTNLQNVLVDLSFYCYILYLCSACACPLAPVHVHVHVLLLPVFVHVHVLYSLS